MGYYDKEKQPRHEIVRSVDVVNLTLTVDSEAGKTVVLCFGHGRVSIYNDLRRIEFKEYGGEDDGRIYGWPFELVRGYAYTPTRKFYEF